MITCIAHGLPGEQLQHMDSSGNRVLQRPHSDACTACRWQPSESPHHSRQQTAAA